MPTEARDPVIRYLHSILGLDGAGPADAELLARFVESRDAEAFEKLVRRHGSLVMGICRRILGADADDAFQATFFVLARKAAKIRKQESVASWLHGVAYTISRSLQTKLTRQRRREAGIGTNVEQITMSADPSQQASLRELGAILDEEVQRLPESCRAALVACHFEGLSTAAAAHQLGVPTSTLKTRLVRGRELLCQRLKRRGIGISAVALSILLGEHNRIPATTALVETTVAAGLRFATGGMTAVATQAAALATSAVRGMLLAKMKLGAMFMFAASITLLTGRLISQPVTTDAAAKRPVAEAPHDVLEKPVDQKVLRRRETIHFDRFGDPLPLGAIARFGTVRFRHAGQISHLVFSPDGTKLVGSGRDGIRVWESVTGRPLNTIDAKAESVMFLDGGRRFGVGGEDPATVELATGKKVRVDIGKPWTSVYSPDGSLLAAADNQGILRLFDARTGAIVKQLEGHEDQIKSANAQPLLIRSLAFSSNSKLLASACRQDLRVLIWDLATGRILHTLPGFHAPLVVQFSNDNRLLAVGHAGFVRVWDAKTGNKLHELNGHEGEVLGLAFAPDNSHLASGASGFAPNVKSEGRPSRDGTVAIWDLKTGKGRPMPGPDQWTHAVAYSPDGKMLAAAGSGTTVHIIDVGTETPRHEPSGHDGAVFRIAISPDGKTLASGGRDNLIHLWDQRTTLETKTISGHESHVSGLAFTPSGGELVACSYDGTVRNWDWSTGKELHRPLSTAAMQYGFAMAPDGKMLLLQTGQLWSFEAGPSTRTLTQVKGLNYSKTKFSPDGKRLAIPFQVPMGGIAAVIDMENGKEVCRSEGHEPRPLNARHGYGPQIYALAYSFDGRFIVSGGDDCQAFIWDAATGKTMRRLTGHEDLITSVAVSPDGRMVATASGSRFSNKDATVRLWEVATGNERRRFAGHQNQVTSVAFTREGRSVISGSEDGAIFEWDAVGSLGAHKTKLGDDEDLWNSLADEDGVKAYESLCSLAARGNVSIIANRLRPMPVPDEQKIGRLIADLDSNVFATREKAQRELDLLAVRAEPLLRKIAAQNEYLEKSRRIEAILAKLDTPALTGEMRQLLRAVEILERIGTAASRRHLELIAGGTPSARLTIDAKQALDRLNATVQKEPRK